jgi:hypothetical protein
MNYRDKNMNYGDKKDLYLSQILSIAISDHLEDSVYPWKNRDRKYVDCRILLTKESNINTSTNIDTSTNIHTFINIDSSTNKDTSTNIDTYTIDTYTNIDNQNKLIKTWVNILIGGYQNTHTEEERIQNNLNKRYMGQKEDQKDMGEKEDQKDNSDKKKIFWIGRK